jgi:hypothetical protein
LIIQVPDENRLTTPRRGGQPFCLVKTVVFQCFFGFDNRGVRFSVADMSILWRILLLMIGLSASRTGVSGGDGVPIIFSGRDGRAVRFDFGRHGAFVPPEMKESRFSRSTDAALVPLIDRSVTPNSGTGRRAADVDKPDRDWIFKNPKSAGSRDSDSRRRPLDRDEERESAMLRFLRGGEEDGERREDSGKVRPDDRTGEGGDAESGEQDRFQYRRDVGRGLTGTTAQRESLLSRLEGDMGLRPAAPAMTLKGFFQAEQRRENEVRRRESMTEFKQLLVNPFSAPGGGGGFAGESGLLRENLPGVAISPGLPGLGAAGAQTGFGGADFVPRPGAGNAFDTPKVPTDFTRSKSFEERKPEPIRRQMSLDIPKRDF